MPFSQKPIVVVFGLVLLWFGAGAVAQDGNYLKELDSEASDLSLDRQTRSNGETGGDIRDAARLSELPVDDELDLGAGLSREDFEKALQRNLMGSYLFYKRLSRDRRDQVYQAYLKNPDPQGLRQIIMKSLKQQRGLQ